MWFAFAPAFSSARRLAAPAVGRTLSSVWPPFLRCSVCESVSSVHSVGLASDIGRRTKSHTSCALDRPIQLLERDRAPYCCRIAVSVDDSRTRTKTNAEDRAGRRNDHRQRRDAGG